MRITIIAGYYYPEQSADTRLNQDLAESLAQKGHKVTLLVPFPSRGIDDKIKKQYLSKRKERINNNLEIYRVGKPTKYKQNILKRGIAFLAKSFQLYKMAKKIKTDIYLVVSTPPTLGYVAIKLSKNNKVIYKLQDAFPDSLMYAKKISNKSIVLKIFRLYEKKVYRKVSSICTISDDLKSTLIKKNVPERKVSVIYDWIDEKKCFPIDKNNNYLYEKFNLNREDKLVVYAGNIGLLQNIKTIVTTSRRFLKTNPDVKFVIIGDGSWKKELERILGDNRDEYKNVFLFPMQSTDEIAYVYSLGDIGLVSLQKNITKIALPSKTWDIMSAGRAVLCEIDLFSKLCNVVQDNKLGYCVSPGDVDEMEYAIRKMLADVDELKKMGERGREYICCNLTREIAIEKYIEIFKRELGEKNVNI